MEAVQTCSMWGNQGERVSGDSFTCFDHCDVDVLVVACVRIVYSLVVID